MASTSKHSARNPDILDKLIEEALSIEGGDPSTQASSTPSLNYGMNFENYAMNFENYAMNFENYGMNVARWDECAQGASNVPTDSDKESVIKSVDDVLDSLASRRR